jgi:hypothetical protein
MRFVDIGSDDPRVVACIIEGKFTAEDMAAFNDRITAIRDSGTKALVYLDLAGYEGQEFGVAKEKLGNMGTLWGGIERIAYVVPHEWMLSLVGVIDALTPMHFRAFSADDAEDGKRWVLEG